jgi:acetylornithine deacetylase/succinyl-diaminopimelate desuccinylase-like protein
MPIKKVHSYIDANTENNILELKKLVAQPSVSNNNLEVAKCSKVLKGIMEKAGIETKIINTDGNPIVFGHLRSNREKTLTLLFYGHYDVQPVGDLDLWESQPFEPEIRNGRMYGRGTADNKGQLITHILAVKHYLEVLGDVPINIKFVFEGEEEIGSKHLAKFARENKELLSADMVYTSDGAMGINDVPNIIFGVRGVMNFDLSLDTSTTDNHSGNKGGVIKNAAWEMVKLLNTMKDEDDNVLIKGFYEDVVPPSEYDLKLIERLPYEPSELAKIYGVEKLELTKNQFYSNLMFKPTLTINGLKSGYIGAGAKNIIPGRAIAKMEVRLAFDQDPEDVFKKIKNHIDNINPRVKIKRVEEDMLPSRTSTDLPLSRTIVKAVSCFFKDRPVEMPVIGGSLPDYIWTKILGVPSISVPYGNADECNHAPNENMKMDLFNKGIHISAQAIYDLGKELSNYS